MLHAKHEGEPRAKIVMPGPQQGNAGALLAPAELVSREQVDDEVRAISGEVNVKAAPEGQGNTPQESQSDRSNNSGEQAVAEFVVKIVEIASDGEANKEIEVGEVCGEDEHREL